jgi:penicillin-binding protein 1A
MAEQKQSLLKRRWKQLWWALVLSPVLALFAMLTLAAFSDLPGTEDLENPRSDLATAVLFSDGNQMGQYYRENRIPVDYARISPNVVNALIATEDERFRAHSGVDLRGTMRAAVFLGKKGGASTLTQQLAKMLFTERSSNFIKRTFQKFQEWIISARLERQYTKDEIIAMYLNRFDWINQAVGIHSAARVYFNTTPDSLRIEEAALLVGMCKNPALFNPLRRPDTTMTRRMVVLDQMRKNGFITTPQYDSLKTLPLGLRFQRVDHTEGPAPYFREVLRGKLQALLAEKDENGELRFAKADGKPYDIYTDGLKVYTTIDRRMQAYAERGLREHLATELQADFFKDLAKKKNRPFDFRVSKEEIDGILNTAMKRSVRYRIMTGKQCGNCERPARYIEQVMHEGGKHFHCRPDLGGCDSYWPVVKEENIPKVFDTPVNMRVFSWKGEIDTVMSPMDSIRYYKSFLQSGLLSMDPHTGFVKAWVGGIDFKHFQYDHVEQARRQVGSTFKPFVYATALREGMDPCREVPARLVPGEQRCRVWRHGDPRIRAGQLDEHGDGLVDEAVWSAGRDGAGPAHGCEKPLGRSAIALPGRRGPHPDGDDRRLRLLRQPGRVHRAHCVHTHRGQERQHHLRCDPQYLRGTGRADRLQDAEDPEGRDRWGLQPEHRQGGGYGPSPPYQLGKPPEVRQHQVPHGRQNGHHAEQLRWLVHRDHARPGDRCVDGCR